MSPQTKNLRALCFAVTALAACAAAYVTQAAPPRSELPVTVDAARIEMHYRDNIATLHEVVIRQGDIKVSAKQATATGGVNNFANNRWEFTGNVQITMQGGSLTAERAAVRFVANRVMDAVIDGAPASFQQQLEDGTTASGRANRIEYDFAGAIVRLNGEAFLTYGGNDIRNQNLTYKIKDQSVIANADTQKNERVHITIDPRANADAKKKIDVTTKPDSGTPEQTKPPAPAEPRKAP